MKYTFSLLTVMLLSLSMVLVSCDDDDDDVVTNTVTIDSSQPSGVFSVDRTGAFVAQNNTPTMGVAELGTDDDAATFLRFSSSFTTEQGTGTVGIYLSTSDTFTADPGNGNPDLIFVGAVSGDGEQFHEVTENVPATFTHVILWCNTASIPFGNAPLQ